MRVPDAAKAADKFALVAPQRAQFYDAGVRDTGVDWAGATAAAKSAWEQGLQEATQRNAFVKGVQNATNAKWLDKTTTVGSPRWAGGVQAAKGDYQTAIAPVLDALSRITLGPRGPRGDPRNYARVQLIGDTLGALRKRV